MKKLFAIVFAVAFTAPAFAQSDTLKVDTFLRYKMTTDFVSDLTYHDFDLSGVRIAKEFGDNFSAVITPGFNFYQRTANERINFGLIEAYFKINDLTSTYGDYGITLVAGQYESPFYTMEQYYQPYRFIYRPIDYKLMDDEYVDLGAMVGVKMFDEAISVSLGYISGRSWLVNLDNYGGTRLVATFFPFKNFGEALEELSLTFNLKSVFDTRQRSNYNFLLGYKYGCFATSLEYLKTYSSDKATDIQAMSFGASYDVWGPLQALARWDYSDAVDATITGSQYQHLFLLGVNTKWFDNALQAAVTYDQAYNPQAKTTMAKRIMVATQVNL